MWLHDKFSKTLKHTFRNKKKVNKNIHTFYRFQSKCGKCLAGFPFCGDEKEETLKTAKSNQCTKPRYLLTSNNMQIE